ncbi:hypothetical protein GQ55_2G430800 [Panicum hallii var. hallii]|uniref:Uncharacterized protein n=1 Tax=Panicum hallii var. hallii TaxID=1504633 RepID=A0A2T7EYG6_9POAL|nr:hypothetical protein GQ55_2G430800 [Panicum hallii var. hallii]
MAANHRSLDFIDPRHLLLRMDYDHESGRCDICRLELAGFDGYGCDSCNIHIHIHSACAGYFGRTTSFALSHALELSRIPLSVGRIRCDICGGCCPPGSFVYRCIGCGFNLHPLCRLLPERFRSPFYPGCTLSMVFSPQRFACSLHISCASIGPPPTGAGVVGRCSWPVTRPAGGGFYRRVVFPPAPARAAKLVALRLALNFVRADITDVTA